MSASALMAELDLLRTQVVTYYVASLVVDGAITEAEAVVLGNIYVLAGLPRG